MAEVVKSIGTSSRDYSTIAAWEADHNNGAVYSSGDTIAGEMYADSDFAMAEYTFNVFVSGYEACILRPADGEGHDGTEDTGVKIVYDANDENFYIQPDVAGKYVKLYGLDIDVNGYSVNREVIYQAGFSNASTGTYRNIIRDGDGADCCGVWSQSWGSAHPDHVIRNICYNMNSTSGTYRASFVMFYGAYMVGNTSHDHSGSGANGFREVNAGSYSWRVLKNNVATAAAAISGFSITVGSQTSHNASDHTETKGSNSVDSIVPADEFISVIAGSIDLNVKDGADIQDAGEDLGTLYESNITAGGRDVDAEGDTWDIGAHEYAVTSASYTLVCDVGTFTLTGNQTTLNVAQSLSLDSGTFAFTGINSEWGIDRNLSLGTGSFILTGNDANLNTGPDEPVVNRIGGAGFAIYDFPEEEAKKKKKKAKKKSKPAKAKVVPVKKQEPKLELVETRELEALESNLAAISENLSNMEQERQEALRLALAEADALLAEEVTQAILTNELQKVYDLLEQEANEIQANAIRAYVNELEAVNRKIKRNKAKKTVLRMIMLGQI